MLLYQKIDFYIQIAILVIVVLLTPIFYTMSIFLGLTLLGILQLLSAGINTYFFVKIGSAKKILGYWIFSLSDLAILEIARSRDANNNVSAYLLLLSVCAGFVISIYYLIIYKSLMDKAKIRNELAGFTKS